MKMNLKSPSSFTVHIFQTDLHLFLHFITTTVTHIFMHNNFLALTQVVSHGITISYWSNELLSTHDFDQVNALRAKNRWVFLHSSSLRWLLRSVARRIFFRISLLKRLRYLLRSHFIQRILSSSTLFHILLQSLLFITRSFIL